MNFYEMDGLLNFILDDILYKKYAVRSELEMLLQEYPEEIYERERFRAFLEKEHLHERYTIDEFGHFIKPFLVLQLASDLPGTEHEEESLTRCTVPFPGIAGGTSTSDNSEAGTDDVIEVVFNKKKLYGVLQWVGKVTEKK